MQIYIKLFTMPSAYSSKLLPAMLEVFSLLQLFLLPSRKVCMNRRKHAHFPGCFDAFRRFPSGKCARIAGNMHTSAKEDKLSNKL